jgi:MerR family transcriptional regulator, light-induced transcriptional regulator
LGQNLSRAVAGQQGLESFALQERSAGATSDSAASRPNATHARQFRDPGAERSQGENDRLAVAETIECEIVPRLVLAQGAGRRAGAKARTLDAAAVALFAQTLLSQDPAAPSAHIEKLLAGGVSLGEICLDLLAPAARHLGAMWDDDSASFTDVMLGLSVLQSLLRQYGPRYRPPSAPEAHHRILLAAAPGETHLFGLLMVEEFFRRAGWDVTCLVDVDATELGKLVHRESFSVVGLSASCDALLEPVAACIHRIRRETRNRSVGIMVGGRVFSDRPDCVALVGADTVAFDGLQAVRQARNMLTMLSDRTLRA